MIFKLLFLIASLLGSTYSIAETKLACWNMYAPRGSLPIMTATILADNVLGEIKFNKKDKFFELGNYNWEDTISNRGRQNRYALSEILDPETEVVPKLNDSARSPYRGNNLYVLKMGRWVYKYTKPGTNSGDLTEEKHGDINGKMYLPTDLSTEFLNTYRIRKPEERSNAVIVVDPQHFSEQYGKNYLRMFCKSE